MTSSVDAQLSTQIPWQWPELVLVGKLGDRSTRLSESRYMPGKYIGEENKMQTSEGKKFLCDGEQVSIKKKRSLENKHCERKEQL